MSQLKCSLIKQKVFKSTHKLPGEKSNPGLLSESQKYLPLFYRGFLFTAIFIAIHFMSQLKCSLIKKKVFKRTHNLPGGESNPGLLSDSQRYLPLYYRGLLFTAEFVAVDFLSQLKCSLIKQKVFKSRQKLPGEKSNPGLLSDS